MDKCGEDKEVAPPRTAWESLEVEVEDLEGSKRFPGPLAPPGTAPGTAPGTPTPVPNNSKQHYSSSNNNSGSFLKFPSRRNLGMRSGFWSPVHQISHWQGLGDPSLAGSSSSISLLAGSIAGVFFPGNKSFLEVYSEHLVDDWNQHYLAHDHLHRMMNDLIAKIHCKQLDSSNFGITLGKRLEHDDNQAEEALCYEIERVTAFIKYHFEICHENVREVIAQSKKVDRSTLAVTVDNSEVPNNIAVERLVRQLYTKIADLKKFYKLNYYAIVKAGVKLDCLLCAIEESKRTGEVTHDQHHVISFSEIKESAVISEDHFELWGSQQSYSIFSSAFVPLAREIDNLEDDTYNLFRSLFLSHYQFMARYDLKYITNRSRIFASTRLMLGLKIGIIIMCIAWLVNLSWSTQESDFKLWAAPSLVVFTCIGNILLCHFLWAVNIRLWNHYNVNYLQVFSLNGIATNVVEVVDDTSTMFVFFFISIILYCTANIPNQAISGSFLSYACPLVLLVVAVCYRMFRLYRHDYYDRASVGLFKRAMFKTFLLAPIAEVTFRDIFAADYLTSFTKIISDTVYSGCWLFTGEFLTSASEGSYCATSPTVSLLASIFASVPLILRLIQCIRLLIVKKNVLQFWNSLKYASSCIVIYWGFFINAQNEDFYIAFIVLTTLYKFYWDVVIDWGLFAIWPKLDCIHNKSQICTKTNATNSVGVTMRQQSWWFLRPLLIFGDRLSIYQYYVAIVLDLGLRFLWVLSLTPKGAAIGIANKSVLNLLVGSLEIFRRFIWGHIRVEYQHIVSVENHSLGFFKLNNEIFDVQDLKTQSLFCVKTKRAVV